MSVRIGLMGFGEIGRDIYQLTLQEQELEVVAISDIGSPEILHYLLRTDGRNPVDAELHSNYLQAGTQRARILNGVAPGDVWAELAAREGRSGIAENAARPAP